MNKEQRRKRRHERMERRKDTARPLGSWDVEYECGLHILVEPTSPSDIEEKVAKLKHACRRIGCRAWRYVRITADNADRFGWGERNGGMDTNTRKQPCKPDKI